jgi:hypothetical protein
MILRVLCGAVAGLLALYLGAGLVAGDIEYGSCPGRMSKNCNATHLTSPLELTVGTLHFGALLFAAGSIALRPAFFLRKPVIVSTVIVFVAAHALLLVLA